MELTNQIDGATHDVHGIRFIRSGSCNRCGACCEVENCSHYKIVKKVPTCTIYDKRSAYCAEHERTHEMCVPFPGHPWCWVLKTGKCGFSFRPVTSEEALKVTKLEIRDGYSS